MRVDAGQGGFKAKAIAGTHTVLIALDCVESKRHGLLGFAIRRETPGQPSSEPKWLRSLKVFKSVVPEPQNERDPRDPSKPRRFSSWEHPIQSFLWGDYTAEPDTLYRFSVVPMHGQPAALDPQPEVTFDVRTEKALDRGHGVWFNRGAIASQAFARDFKNKAPQDPNDPKDPETAWLSRGLLEACLAFIDDTPAGDGLRVAAYEFTYPPVLNALKTALERGVNVSIIYDDTATDPKRTNEAAIEQAGLPTRRGRTQVLFPRAKPKIPHNKFIVRLHGGQAEAVWTGSTNFTPSGFLGQSNVGHVVADADTAGGFLEYWNVLKDDPDRGTARTAIMLLTPNPQESLPADSTSRVFSPRPRSELLKWYGRRIRDAQSCVMFTAAFGVTEQLVGPLAEESDLLRFILMEKPPTQKQGPVLRADRDLIISFGASLGEMYVFKNGQPVARKPIAEFELEKWLLRESHFRRAGHVFFVHTKFLLVDPLSDDPLVFTGSANFSPDSLLENDENMLLIRGNTRVADIYMTEFDRLFRHFYFRNVANEVAVRGGDAEGVFLSETPAWTNDYFKPGGFKTKRRQMFFSSP